MVKYGRKVPASTSDVPVTERAGWLRAARHHVHRLPAGRAVWRVGVTLVGSAIILVAAVLLTALTFILLINPKSAVLAWVVGPCSLFLWGLGLWLLRYGLRLARARIALLADGLEISSHTFRIAKIRRMQSARFRWEDVRAVQYSPVVNFLSAGGVERNYLVHTTGATYLISSNFWPNAATVARLIAERIGRAIDETPIEILESQKDEVRKAWFRYALLRAFGWFCVVFGAFTIVVLTTAEFGGAQLPIEEVVITAIVAVILVLGGRSMAKYRPPIDTD